MLPQLSYIVAQAGVDARLLPTPPPPPPSMLPRLTKPLYTHDESPRLDHVYSPHSLRPDSDTSATPPRLPQHSAPTSRTPYPPMPTLSSSYVYPSSSLPHLTTTVPPAAPAGAVTPIPPQQKSLPVVISSYQHTCPAPQQPPRPATSSFSIHHHYPVNDSWGSVVEPSKPSSGQDAYLRRTSRGFMVPDQPTVTTTATTTWDEDNNYSNSSSNDGLSNGHIYPTPSENHGLHEAMGAGSGTAPAAAVTLHRYTSSHRVGPLKEWNQLLTWMEHQFQEQKEDTYQEKLTFLQQELKSLQNDAHKTYLELVADLDMKRQTMIADAACFLKYQQEWVEQLYQEDMAVIEEEYNVERRHLHDAIIAVIEDRKKLIKEDKDHGLLKIKDLFSEAYSRVTNKRTLRKRPATESSRQDSRKRQARHTATLLLDSALAKEEDELDEELMLMKKEPHALAI